jgi:RNA polymerase sigma factor (sigma-70 family)
LVIDDPTDAELWQRVAAGDGDAFSVLFERHAQAIYNFCFRRTADWAAAEDLTSRTFLEAWRRRAEVRPVGQSLLPWLYGVAVNLVRTEARTRRRRLRAFARMPRARHAGDIADDVAGRLDDERRMREILAALEQLPEIDREILALASWQQLSYEEIATALDLPLGTVRSRLSRARARLRDLANTAADSTSGRHNTASPIGDGHGTLRASSRARAN